MSISRRSFIYRCFYSGVLILGSGLFSRISRAAWPAAAFDETEYLPALKGLIGDEPLLEGHVTIQAPEVAENGATVPVKISTDLTNVEWISIFGDKNPRPWISRFYFHGKSKPFVSTRIKLRESSNVVAIVKAEGKLYSTKSAVRVTAGGCV
ncbi:MAG: thiosulfate oxidation carrier protein SoxY [Gammaproteobacteria bacterium]|nr:thiosulfate oxidation carrier protein SoxY [Gammaproteobacteria bacterium]